LKSAVKGSHEGFIDNGNLKEHDIGLGYQGGHNWLLSFGILKGWQSIVDILG